MVHRVEQIHTSASAPGKFQCTHLCVNGALVSDPSHLLQVWTEHFQNLAKPQVETNPALEEVMKQSTFLLSNN